VHSRTFFRGKTESGSEVIMGKGIKYAGWTFASKAAIEQNPEKLAALIKEIDRILGEEVKRLDESRKGPNGQS
jgi:ABC-type nitrate/sulfonate/bicarbonate transport system substrate-binding protein